MRKLIPIILTVILIHTTAFAQNTYNPGYFKSPGFLAVAGASAYSKSDTAQDLDIAPQLLLMLNVVQSEYGNIGLSLGSFFTMPYNNQTRGSYDYELKTKHISGELGINYTTGSKSINFWVGIGYNLNYVFGDIKNVRNGGAPTGYTKSVSDTTFGWHYYAGFEYMLTKDGRWGAFILFRGLDAERAKFNIDDLGFEAEQRVGGKTYSAGIIYHF